MLRGAHTLVLTTAAIVLGLAWAPQSARAQMPSLTAALSAEDHPGPVELTDQDEPQPGFIVVRYFDCPDLSRALELFQQWRPLVVEMVEEGTFMGYGILRHAWGDDWSMADYFVVEDLGEFFDDYAELARRGQERFGEPEEPFHTICPRHKDNIYGVVQPPEAP